MAAATQTMYACWPEHIGKGTIDYDNDVIMMMLLSSAYTLSATTHAQLADVSANEIAAGFGYTAGGVICTSSIVRVGATTTYNLGDGVWTASGGPIPACRTAVVYALTSRNSVTNPLITSFLLDSAPADLPATVDGAVLRIRVNPLGLFTSP